MAFIGPFKSKLTFSCNTCLPKQYIAMNEQQIPTRVFNAGIKVHKAFGPGLLESAYQEYLNWVCSSISTVFFSKMVLRE